MSIYSEAVSAVLKYSEAMQAALDELAATARENSIKECREMAVKGVVKDSPEYAVCQLVSSTLTVGRESDNYPIFSIPQSTRDVLIAARAADVMDCDVGELKLHPDFSGLVQWPKFMEKDREAWTNAENYRKNQKIQALVNKKD